MNSSSVQGLNLYEANAKPSEAPWATVKDIRADVSAWGLIFGKALPKRLEMDGVELTLRLDRGGRLITRLPKSEKKTTTLPGIRIEQGHLTLKQEGRPDFVVGGVNARVVMQGEQLVLTGSINDDYWGQWALDGSLDEKSDSSAFTLRTPHTHVTQEKLNRLPFVPATVWEQVQCMGDSPVELTLRMGPGSNRVHYRLVVEPESARVHVTSIDLTAEQVRGKVVIEDGAVLLTDVTGRAADGTIKTDAALDFHEKPNVLKFTVHTDHLELRQLPPKWKLPQKLNGRLNGQADLIVTLLDKGKFQTSGSGQGQIANPSWGSLCFNKPITLHLHSDGKRFQFSQPTPPAESGAWARPVLITTATALFLSQPNAQLVEQSATSLPARLANQLGEGIVEGVETLVSQGSALLGKFPAAVDAVAKPKAEPSYLDANLGLDKADMQELLQATGVKLPFAVTGRVSFQVQLSIPLNTAGDLKAYRLKGTASSARLSLAGLTVEQVQAKVAYANGVLRLEELRGLVPDGTLSNNRAAAPGSFEGTAQLDVVPQGDPAAQRALRMNPYHYTGQVALRNIDLAILRRLAPEFRPPVDVAGVFEVSADLKGTLNPLTVQSSGTGELSDMTVDRVAVRSVRFRWTSDNEHLNVSDLRSSLYGGEISGKAQIPLQAKAAGSMDLQFKDLDVSRLAKALPSLPIRVEGTASGTFEGTLAPAAMGQPRGFRSKLDLQAPKLRVQGIPAERLHGTVDYRGEGIDYRLEGDTLGGSFHLNGRVPAADLKPADRPPEGRLRIQGAHLSRLWPGLGLRSSLAPLRGLVDVNLAFRHEGPNRRPVGTGTFTLSRLRWAGTELAEVIQGNLLLTDQELRFRNLTGPFAEGVLFGQASLNLHDLNQSWINLSVDGADASALLAPLPALASRVAGPLTLRVRGRLGREWSGTAEVGLARGRIVGAEVTDLRLPLDWAFAPGHFRGQIDVRDGTAQVRSGRVTAQATLGIGWGTRMDGHLRFYGVQLRPLLHQMTDLSQIGSGTVTGRFDFGGTDVRSVDDVTGTIEARLQQAQALQLPVLQQVAPFLGPSQSSSSFFQSGDLRARLARGVFRIERLAFAGTAARILVEGTVTVEGRLNLAVTANTGRFGVNPTFLQFIGLRIPTLGPVPVALLLQATTYLSNRVVHLRVTGTIRTPIITVEPLSLLTETAFQFFINQANVPLP
jgi:hypothetical protein